MAWFEGFERLTTEVAGLPVCFRRTADWAQQTHLPVLVLLPTLSVPPLMVVLA